MSLRDSVVSAMFPISCSCPGLDFAATWSALTFSPVASIFRSTYVLTDLRQWIVFDSRNIHVSIVSTSCSGFTTSLAQAVNVVINFDFPKMAETYLHRIGRSGRLIDKKTIMFPQDWVNKRKTQFIIDLLISGSVTLEWRSTWSPMTIGLLCTGENLIYFWRIWMIFGGNQKFVLLELPPIWATSVSLTLENFERVILCL